MSPHPYRLRLTGAVLTSATLVALALAGCSSGTQGGEASGSGPVPITVSIAPQKAFLEAIGGDRVDVTVMVPQGSEPATYEPKPKQVAALSRSRAYFSIGVPFEEAWLPRFRSAAPDVPVVDTTAGIERGTLGGGQPDPHIWLDPELVETQGRTYAKALEKLDPDHAEDYRAGLSRFEAAVQQVDSDLEEMLAPYAGTSFMIFHPVLNYFADEYGLEPINIEADGDEPSASDMQRLVEAGREEDVSAVLVEPQFSQRASRTIADQLGVPVQQVDPLATDWADNMREIGTTLVTSFEASS